MRPGAIRLVAAAVLLAFLSVPLLGADRGTAQQASDTPDTVNLYFYREDELGVAIRDDRAWCRTPPFISPRL
ncbi:MAG: hypothetical protein R2843_12870 [Thermomicrobiales bacterium]